MNTNYRVLETDFQQQIEQLAHMLDWRTMHVRRSVKGERGGWVTATSVAGWPDLVLWHEQHGILFREIKTESGKITQQQLDVLMSLRAAGGDAQVWRPSMWTEIEAQLKGNKP